MVWSVAEPSDKPAWRTRTVRVVHGNSTDMSGLTRNSVSTSARTPVVPLGSSHRDTVPSRAHSPRFRAVNGLDLTVVPCGTAHACLGRLSETGLQWDVATRVRLFPRSMHRFITLNTILPRHRTFMKCDTMLRSGSLSYDRSTTLVKWGSILS